MRKFIIEENLVSSLLHNLRRGSFPELNYDSLTVILRALSTLPEYKEPVKDEVKETKEKIEQNINK